MTEKLENTFYDPFLSPPYLELCYSHLKASRVVSNKIKDYHKMC